MNLAMFLLVFVAVFVLMVPLSMLVESLRPKSSAPAKLGWAEDIEINKINIKGVTLRYIKTGEGPNLLLLHTLRTQLDIFQKIIPELSKSFTVYAVDYPGHGWSDIPDADYALDFFVNGVEEVIETLDLDDLTIAGVSIGATIPLVLAGKQNSRINKVIAINPYDYPGKGAARGNAVANFFMSIIYVPILGDTFMRFRMRLVEKMIFAGGVYDANDLPAQFLEECFVVGERPGHLKGFINLIRHSNSFMQAHDYYQRITIPVLLIYGEEDWATSSEREQTAAEIPNVSVKTVPQAGHFMSLEKPELLIEEIRTF